MTRQQKDIKQKQNYIKQVIYAYILYIYNNMTQNKRYTDEQNYKYFI